MLPSPRTEWASVEQTTWTPASMASRDVVARQIEAVGQAVDLERDARLERDLDRALEIERVLRPVSDQAARSDG